MFFTYILYSKRFGKIYIGFTSDLEKRLASHNDEKNKGWTKKFQPWTLAYSEEFQEKADAMKREKQLKSGNGRAFIHSEIISKLQAD